MQVKIKMLKGERWWGEDIVWNTIKEETRKMGWEE